MLFKERKCKTNGTASEKKMALLDERSSFDFRPTAYVLPANVSTRVILSE